MNPTDCVWKELSQEFMKSILQGKVTIHCIIAVLYTIFPMSSDENTGSERSSGHSMEKT